MFGKPTTSFDKLIEKATSQLLLDPDWNTILQICDAVRQEDVTPKAAIAIVKKKITNDNPHVAKFALILLESMVKNCGAPIQQEVATKDMMDFMREQILKRPEPIKLKLLELVQVWSHAFRTQPAYKIVEDTYKMLKHEGHVFPVLREADAMFAAEKAPEWKDGDTCHRCKDKFGTFNRKHHCRCCGDIFCHKCSSKNSIVPQFGIEREVRVCDACFDRLNATGVPEDEQLPAEYLASSLARQPQVSQVAPAKSERDIQQQEEEELQLAIALSQSEAEAKAKERERGRSASSRATQNSQNGHSNVSSAPQANNKYASVPAIDMTDMDPELARYLDRNYWQQRREDSKQGMQQPSAPVAQIDTTAPAARAPDIPAEVDQNGSEGGGAEGDEQFMDAVEKSIEIFVNRMKSDSLRGRSIAADSSVQTLFVTLSTMHSELLKNLQKLDDNRVYYESLQDKLAELKDAREALEVLREEHREKRRLEQEEQERQRQLAMAHKLDVLRLKKQEYLEHQRQLALQRMQEQELEMQMRIEQQKQMQQMRQMYNNPYMQTVYGPMTITQPYPGQAGSDESSPHHYPAGAMPYGAGAYLPGQPPSGFPSGPQGPGAPYQQQQGGGGGQSVGATYYPSYPGNQPPYHPAQQGATPAGYIPAGQQPGAAGTFQGQQQQLLQAPFQGQGQSSFGVPQQGVGGGGSSFQGYVGQGGPYQGQGQMDAYQLSSVGGYQGQPPAEYAQYAQQSGQYQQGQGLAGPQSGSYGGQDMAPLYQQLAGPPRSDSQLISFD